MKNKRLAILIVLLVVILNFGTAFLIPIPALNVITGMIYGFFGMNIYLKKTQHLR